MKTSYISSFARMGVSMVLALGLCATASSVSAQQASAAVSAVDAGPTSTPVSADGGGSATISPTSVVIPAASFGGADLSMLTNHAALVGYAFKRVQSVQAQVTSGSQVGGDSGVRTYPYTNSIKSIDNIMSSILANEHWHIEIVSNTDFVNLSIQLNDALDSNGNVYALFTGGSSSQPTQNPYGQWVLPSSATRVGVQLNSQIKIHIPGAQLAGAELIARDQWGNPYPVNMIVDGDGFLFDTAYAGNGTLVLSGWTPLPNNPNWLQWTQSAISLKDGSPVALTWVDAQVILNGSQDIAQFKDQSDLTTLVYDWNGYGTVPMGQAVFTTPATNVLLNTYTISGLSATSYQVEDQATHLTKTYTVPAGATSVTTGTNILKGTYYIYPQGINVMPWNGGGGGGVGIGQKG